MKLVLAFLTICFLSCKHNEKKSTTVTDRSNVDTLWSTEKFESLKAGLFINQKGDIGLQAFEKLTGDSKQERFLEIFITRVNTGTLNADGGPAYLKAVVDTSTFEYLGEGYYLDKKHVYYLTPNSDGGSLNIISNANAGSFHRLGYGEFASDSFSYYQYGKKVDRRQLKMPKK